MESAASPARRYTVAEYMALEAQEDIRREFYEGELQPLPNGDAMLHNLLVGNIFSAFRQDLRGKGYRVFAQSVQLEVIPNKYYCYPDVMVTCAPADFGAERTLTAPTVPVEVISEQTVARDRTWKFNQYKQLPSLRHYLLVLQATCSVEWYRREANDAWSFTPLLQFTDEINLPELGITITLNDMYEDTGVVQMAAYPGGKAPNGQAPEEVSEKD